jgi:hypothetical protein
MKIWTTVGASVVIMVISVLLVLAGKIIGQDTNKPLPEKILPTAATDDKKSGTAPGQKAFDLQQDIILKLSQRIAELETAAAENAAAPLDNSTATQVPREEEKVEFVPSALPLESNPPQSSSSALPDVAADIPLAEFSPEPGGREDFGEALAPYGEWFTTEDYGEVWQPSMANNNSGWAPYTNGGWHSTELGWHFTSSDPWGWACYHYGRWIRYHDIGWCWTPGRRWAPSWVSWRISDGHIGWCPLPPSATWSHRTGIGHWVDARCNLGPAHYNFVSISNFGSRNCRPLIYDRRTNFSLILATRNITLIAGIQHSSRIDISNHGPNRDFVAHRQGRRIPRLQIRPEAGRCGLLNRVDRDNQHLVTHRLQNFEKRTTALPRVRSLSDKTKDSGWDSIRDKDKKIKLRNHIVATAQLEDTKKSSSLPHRGRPGQADSPPDPQEVTRVTPRALKGIGGRQPQPQKVVQRVISRDEKLNAEQQKQTLLRQRADDAKKTRATEDAGRNAIAEQQKQTLLRQRNDDAKRTRAIEDARRNAFAEQQQQQELLRKRADDAKKTRAIEDARRNAIAQQQKQTLLRKRADDAKKTRAIEDARRNAIAQQQKQTLLRKRADDAKKTRAIEDARRNAIAQQQKQQELLRRRADDAKKTRAIEDARRNAIAQQQKQHKQHKQQEQQELLRRRADDVKKTRVIEDARRGAAAQQQKLLRKRGDDAKKAMEHAPRNKKR